MPNSLLQEQIRIEVAHDRLGRAVALLLDAVRSASVPLVLDGALAAARSWSAILQGELGGGSQDGARRVLMTQILAVAAAASVDSRAEELIPDTVTDRAPLLVVSGVAKSFGQTRVLREVELTMHPGRIVGVVGGNASGKTTLLRMVVGELAPDEGAVNWLGTRGDPDPRLPGSGVAYVPQSLPAWSESVTDTLEYVAAMTDERFDSRRVEWWTHRFGLYEVRHKRWGQLSGGFRLRVSLAAALLANPRLLVLDEPLAALDLDSLQTVLEDLRTLTRSPRSPLAILMTSHQVHEIEAVADELLILHAGRARTFDLASRVARPAYRAFEVGAPRDGVRWESFARVLDARVERRMATGAVLTGAHLDAESIAGLARRWEVRVAWLREITGTAAASILDPEPDDRSRKTH